jgi:hypothetical protein
MATFPFRAVEALLATVFHNIEKSITEVHAELLAVLQQLDGMTAAAVGVGTLEDLRFMKNHLAQQEARAQMTRLALEAMLDDEEAMLVSCVPPPSSLPPPHRRQALYPSFPPTYSSAFIFFSVLFFIFFKRKRSPIYFMRACPRALMCFVRPGFTYDSSSGKQTWDRLRQVRHEPLRLGKPAALPVGGRCARAARVQVQDGEMCELLLEAFLQTLSLTQGRLDRLRTAIMHGEQRHALRLATNRNHLLAVQLCVAIVLMCSAVPNVVGGFFGMNVANHHEDQPEVLRNSHPPPVPKIWMSVVVSGFGFLVFGSAFFIHMVYGIRF